VKDSTQIKEPLLRELIKLTVPVRAIVIGGHGGFALHFRVSDSEKTLVTSRGAVRRFASLDTAGGFIRDIGITGFEVDMSSHQPGRLRSPRPDRAEALRSTRTRLRQQSLEFQHGETASV
jgi:hypothetical protein